MTCPNFSVTLTPSFIWNVSYLESNVSASYVSRYAGHPVCCCWELGALSGFFGFVKQNNRSLSVKLLPASKELNTEHVLFFQKETISDCRIGRKSAVKHTNSTSASKPTKQLAPRCKACSSIFGRAQWYGSYRAREGHLVRADDYVMKHAKVSYSSKNRCGSCSCADMYNEKEKNS